MRIPPIRSRVSIVGMRSILDWVRNGAIAMFVGAAVSSFYAIATWPTGFWTIIFIGAVIGGVSFLCVRAMQTAVGFLLRRASVRVQRTVITFASVAAGAFGRGLGLVSGRCPAV